jgi:hypothetical protein
MFGNLLWKKWVIGCHRDAIVGYWIEDGSHYIINVPYQLRDDIIRMQNWLSDKYLRIERLKDKLRRLEGFFENER